MSKLHHTEWVLNAIHFIEKNLTENISVQDVCSQIPISTWQFQRLFRALVGDSLGGYIRGRRLTMAAELLMTSKEKILDIAVIVQFGSQEAFSRAFKNQFMVTPGQLRENPETFKIYKKPLITEQTLRHLESGIQREPEIRRMGPLNLIGIETTISSFLGGNPDFESKLPDFWQKFGRLKKEKGLNITADNYGVAVSSSETMMEETLKYFASVLAEDQRVPEGMCGLFIEEKTYAIFENVGLADKTLSTIDYIYGIWLPESEYSRGRGFDFEIFDHRYRLKDPNSVSRYCLPLQ